MKLGIALDDELLARIDNYADKNYMSRSGFISLACTQLLNAEEVKISVMGLSKAMEKIADTNELDHETIEQLEDFQRVVKVIFSNKS